MLLTLGFVVLAVLLLTAVVSASAVHLDRKRLLALADLTALACADALDEEAYYAADRQPAPEGGTGVLLTESSVRQAATEHLATAAPATGLEDVRLVSTSLDGQTVSVTLHAVTRPVLISAVTAPWSDGIDLTVTASATTR
ncbi:hypothetical protein [Actinotalea sp.]|uniref:hypothetical protein n=1 Tax=Actinotalea sp. TaxID=1872145 RepID=UPI003566FFF2